MSDFELFFFLLFIAIQILLPLRRYAYALFSYYKNGRCALFSDQQWFFSWTMMLSKSVGYVDYTVYYREDGSLIKRFEPDKILLPKQYKFLIRHPHAAIQYAKYIQHRFDLDSKNYGISIYHERSLNGRKFKLCIDPETDFCQEKVHIIRNYQWLKV